MNYYKIFYWLTVADNAREMFLNIGMIMLIAFIIALIISAILTASDEIDAKSRKVARKWMWWSGPICIVMVLLNVLTPSKRDSLLILAGGGTLTFLTTDSTAREIPHELSSFVISELKSMTTDAKVSIDLSTQREKILEAAKNMSAVELMEKMKVDSTFARIILNK